MPFYSLAEIESHCREEKKSFFEVILEDDMNERKVNRE